MRNYPLTIMTKTWRPQFPGMTGSSQQDYTKVLIPDKIRDIVINSPRLKTLLDTVSTAIDENGILNPIHFFPAAHEHGRHGQVDEGDSRHSSGDRNGSIADHNPVLWSAHRIHGAEGAHVVVH